MNNLIYITYADTQAARSTQMFLENEGYEVQCFDSSDILYEAFQHRECNLVIVDIDAPGSDCFVTCAKIKQHSNLPIIVLNGEESEEHYIFGITMGVDIYLTKPVSRMKLIAHVRALFVRSSALKIAPATQQTPQQTIPELTYADIEIHRGKRAIYCGNTELQLTHTEYLLLLFMIENQGRAISRKELFQTIWGEKDVSIKVTDDTIKRIRKKLSDANSVLTIDTMWGFGFRLSA